jgi:uncharacterized integral membrane protein
MPDAPPVEAPDVPNEPSLKSDIDALISDGKTYLEAELTYQKSRAGFAANRLKWTAIYGAAAFGLLHLALIALTVGAVIALAPLTGPWMATAIVVALLLAGALVFVLRLRSKVGDIRGAFEDAP